MSEVSATGAALRGMVSRLAGHPVVIDRTGDRGADRAGRTDRVSDRPSDRVEFSDWARFRARLREPQPVRQALIDTVRTQIQAGVYDTPEKLSAAVDGLIDDAELTA